MNEKCILILSLELVKVDGYDFPHPCNSSRFKRPLADTEFDMAAYSSRRDSPICNKLGMLIL
jgi:hypothetical protein